VDVFIKVEFRLATIEDLGTDAHVLQNCKRDAGCPTPKWHIGETGIKPSDIVIIGAVHVSAGTWMPILQLNRFII